MAPPTLTEARDPYASPGRPGATTAPDTPPLAEHDRTEETTGPEGPIDVRATVLTAVGGPWGIVASAIPTVVFATAVAFVSLPISIAIAVVVAVVAAAVQLRRGQSLSSASGGLIGVAAAGGVSAATGSANDFFLIGIWAALVIGVVTFASILVRRPLTGVIWNAVHGGAHAWRADPPTLRAHYIATAAVTLMFAARFAVKEWLYRVDSTSALAVADTALGFPLTGLVAVVVVWAFRRSTKRLVTSADPAGGPQD